jgi:hypothetical protein
LRLPGLSAQGGVERSHRSADLGRIATGIRRVQRFGGVNDRTVVGAQRRCSLWAIGTFALKGFVQWSTEHFPEFLFGLAVQRH